MSPSRCPTVSDGVSDGPSRSDDHLYFYTAVSLAVAVSQCSDSAVTILVLSVHCRRRTTGMARHASTPDSGRLKPPDGTSRERRLSGHWAKLGLLPPLPGPAGPKRLAFVMLFSSNLPQIEQSR